jgi:hypothetical protein
VNYRRIFLEEIERNRPIYVVLAKEGPITPGLPDSLNSFWQFEELQKWVTANYELEKETNTYILYRHKGNLLTTG